MRTPAFLLLAFLLSLALLTGCEEFAETVGCIPPTVLDDDDNCVTPTVPPVDAGAADAGP